MAKHSKGWEAKEVILVPKYIDEKQHQQLLTELALILYDLSCQFRSQSLSASSENHTRGLPKQEAVSE